MGGGSERAWCLVLSAGAVLSAECFVRVVEPSTWHRALSTVSCVREGPLRNRPDQVLERIRQVIPIVQDVDPSGAPLQQEREQRGVRLGRVAGDAGQDQVIRPVIGRLSPAGPHMVQGDGVGRCQPPAIGTDRPMPVEKPLTVGLKGTPRRTLKERGAAGMAALARRSSWQNCKLNNWLNLRPKRAGWSTGNVHSEGTK